MLGDMEKKFVQKIYTSIEDVIKDYDSRDDITSIAFSKDLFEFTLNLNEEGEIQDLNLPKHFSKRRFLARNLLIKTRPFMEIIKEWVSVGSGYKEELREIYDFIESGGYSWTAHPTNDYGELSDIFVIRSSREILRKRIEEIVSFLKGVSEEDFERLLEEMYDVAFERRTFPIWKPSAGIDYQPEVDEEKILELAKGSFREEYPYLEGLLSRKYHGIENIIAILGKKENKGKVYTEIRKVDEEGESHNIELETYIYREREEYLKSKVLPFTPEAFYVSRRYYKDLRSKILSLVIFQPSSLEIGVVVIGNREGDKKINICLLPFIATNSKVGLKMYSGRYTSGLNIYIELVEKPILFVYKTDFQEKEGPRFQVLSLSKGPGLSMKLKESTMVKEKLFYSPLIEYFSSPSKKGENPKVHRRFFGSLRELDRRYSKEYKIEVGRLEGLLDILKYLSNKYLYINVLEKNRIKEMLLFSKELMRELNRRKSSKSAQGTTGDLTSDLETVSIEPDELGQRDKIGIIKKSSILCYPSRYGEKAIINVFNPDNLDIDILKVGSLLGSLGEKEPGMLLITNFSLHEIILGVLEKYMVDDSSENTFSEIIKDIEKYSKPLEEIESICTVNIEKTDPVKEVDEKMKMIEVSEKGLIFSKILQVARDFLLNVGNSLEKEGNPYISVILKYQPKIELYFEPMPLSDDYDEWEYDVEKLFNLTEPDEIYIYPLIENVLVFIDFKETGLRIAAVR